MERQGRARTTGLLFALITRVLLLCSIFWLTRLTDPLFALFGHGVSGRALVMIGPDLTVEWVHKGPPLEIPGANLIFDALDQHAPA